MTPKKTPVILPMRYIGNGAFVSGVPARDLSAAEWLALTEEQREAAKTLYVADETPPVEEG
jgi:hypothetical protein